jgi:hypothetical protein
MTKHGHKRKSTISPEYKIWLQIKRRCSDQTSADFRNYGGRGIKVCPEWANSFEAFLADMGPKPIDTSVLRRRDTKADYTPANCEWSTAHDVATGKRRGAIPVAIGGLEFPTMAAACRFYGVKRSAALYRVQNGISLEEAVSSQAWSQKPRRTRESYLSHGHPDRNKD